MGRGAYLLTSLLVLEKAAEAPCARKVLAKILCYRPAHSTEDVRLCVGNESLRALRQVGCDAPNVSLEEALVGTLALIDGERVGSGDFEKLISFADRGNTLYLHALSREQTERLLNGLSVKTTSGLPVQAKPFPADGTHCVVRHNDRLTDGISNNNLYWTVGAAGTPIWQSVPIDREAATCVIENPEGERIVPLTEPCALAKFLVGEGGSVVLDNLLWQRSGFDEPERPRRYLARLLTNLGVKLGLGEERRFGKDTESAEERRERGKF